MPPGRFVRAAINAEIGGGEKMVHTLHIKFVLDDLVGAQVTDERLQRLATGLVTGWTRFINVPVAPNSAAMRDVLSTSTRYTSVDVALLNSTGTATQAASAAFAPGVAGLVTSVLPHQLSIVASLLTNRPGRSNRGRMFLGGWGGGNAITGPDGRVSTLGQNVIGLGLSRFLREVRDIEEDSQSQQDFWEPQVVSRTKGTARKIEAVSVGNVYDTQRSRRSSLGESRVVANLPA